MYNFLSKYGFSFAFGFGVLALAVCGLFLWQDGGNPDILLKMGYWLIGVVSVFALLFPLANLIFRDRKQSLYAVAGTYLFINIVYFLVDRFTEDGGLQAWLEEWVTGEEFSDNFLQIAYWLLGFAVVMLLFMPLLKRLGHPIKAILAGVLGYFALAFVVKHLASSGDGLDLHELTSGNFSGVILTVSYILLGAVLLLTLFFALKNYYELKKVGIGLGVIVVVLGLSWLLANSEVTGLTDLEEGEGLIRFSGALLKTSYVIVGLGVLGIIAGEIRSSLKS